MKYFVISLLIHLIHGNILEEGKCPEVSPLKNYDAKKILGVWYLIQHYPNNFDNHYKCLRQNFTLTDTGDIIVHYTITQKITNKIVNGNATLFKVGDPNVGSFLVTCNKCFPKIINISLAFLDTDYENYLTTWACTEENDTSARFAWILGRTKAPSLEIIEKAKALLKFDKLNPGYMEVVDHETCNY